MENDQENLDKLEEICCKMNDLKGEYEDIKAIIIALGVGFLTTAFSVGSGVSIKTAVWFAIGGTVLSYFYDMRKR